jgi:pimeloyl-ACP methyl ester carboxylesterase
MSIVKSKDGTAIAYDQTGTGPAVILVGGALNSRTFGVMGPVVPLLEPRYTVIHYDRRGRGDSGNTKPYAVKREVDDLEALIDAVGGSAYVYGNSSGAALALEAANQLGDKVKKLVVYEAPFVVDNSRAPLPTNFVAHLDELTAANQRGAAVKYFMTKGVGVPAFGVAMMRIMPVWSKLKAMADTLPYDAATLGDAASGKPLPAQHWAAITAPTLVVCGGKSPAWMGHAMQALADVLPNAQHRTLAGQTHIVSAEAIAPVLIEFFSA